MTSNMFWVTVIYISWFNLYVNLLFKLERQAPIRRAPFSSDNSCYVVKCSFKKLAFQRL